MILRRNHKSSQSLLNAAAQKKIHKQRNRSWMGIAPHNRISTKHKKRRGRTPRSSRKILNKLEGRKLLQKTRDPWLLIPRPLRTVGKQPSPMGDTPTMLLWFLPDQDSTHDLCNTNQMANKTNLHWKNRHGRSLPPNTCTCKHRIDMHCDSWRASLSLFEVTLWHHTCTSGINKYQWSGNRPRQRSTSRSILGHKWS